MKKSKFTEEQIAFALHKAQTGTSVEEVCRKVGVSQATFYARQQQARRCSGDLLHSACSW